MHYGRRTRRDSISPMIPVLLSAGALGLLAIVWRRVAAPRATARVRSDASDEPEPSAPNAASGADVQTAQSGTGSIFHRKYEVELTGSSLGAAAVLHLMHGHLAELSPSMLAHFEKSSGRDGALRVGDEYEITMLGPWNGMVRVSEITDTSFTLATLDGHPEAGHITFSVTDIASGVVQAQIESWARSRDAVVETAYATFGIGKQVQTEAWVTFLQRLCTLAGAAGTTEVQITDAEIPVSGDPDTATDHAPNV